MFNILALTVRERIEQARRSGGDLLIASGNSRKRLVSSFAPFTVFLRHRYALGSERFMKLTNGSPPFDLFVVAMFFHELVVF